jgi:hypothetical protein
MRVRTVLSVRDMASAICAVDHPPDRRPSSSRSLSVSVKCALVADVVPDLAVRVGSMGPTFQDVEVAGSGATRGNS